MKAVQPANIEGIEIVSDFVLCNFLLSKVMQALHAPCNSSTLRGVLMFTQAVYKCMHYM